MIISFDRKIALVGIANRRYAFISDNVMVVCSLQNCYYVSSNNIIKLNIYTIFNAGVRPPGRQNELKTFHSYVTYCDSKWFCT